MMAGTELNSLKMLCNPKGPAVRPVLGMVALVSARADVKIFVDPHIWLCFGLGEAFGGDLGPFPSLDLFGPVEHGQTFSTESVKSRTSFVCS